MRIGCFVGLPLWSGASRDYYLSQSRWHTKLRGERRLTPAGRPPLIIPGYVKLARGVLPDEQNLISDLVKIDITFFKLDPENSLKSHNPAHTQLLADTRHYPPLSEGAPPASAQILIANAG